MKNVLKLAGASLLALTLGTVTYATDITSIMGTGIPAEGWVANESSATAGKNNVQVALRVRANYGAVLPVAVGANNPTEWPYIFQAQAGTDAGRALWNIDFSINSDMDGGANGLNNLTTYSYKLNFLKNGVLIGTLDPITFWGDNSYGNNATGQSAGVETNAPGSWNIAQNSQNAIFPWPGIDPNENAYYDFELQADNVANLPSPYAYTALRVIVGSGVPDGGTTALLLGAGLVGMSFIARRRKTA